MSTALDDAAAVESLVAAWLPAQRWFGGKDRAVDEVRLVARTPVPTDGSLEVEHLLLTVTQQGHELLYQVPVSVHLEWNDRLEHARLGDIGGVFVYDALHDKAATAALLRGFAEGVPGLAFHVEPGAEIPYGEPSIVLSGEQSNTSLVFGDVAILKVFRRVAPGAHPDIEIHDALTRAGSNHVAPLLGWVDSDHGSLMMLQRFLVTATDGWALAAASVRDLFAEGDLHADEVGGDFAAESHRLGAATAEVHAAMAKALGSDTRGREGNAAVAGDMHRRLDEAITVVPELATYAAGLRSAFDDLAALDGPVPVQRVHGDFHLGQVLRTVVGWKLLDFEGEPAKTLDERRALDSPARDVAGMLRSFDYAARHQVITDRPGEPQIAYRASEWADRNRDAFLSGYGEAAGRQIARDPVDGVLLRAYETDKAVYEAVYEARNRPRWLAIPMAAIERLTAVTHPVAERALDGNRDGKDGDST